MSRSKQTTARPTAQQYADAIQKSKAAWDLVRYSDKASMDARLAAYQTAHREAIATARAYARKNTR